MTIDCVLCATTADEPAAGWTVRTLSRPVTCRSTVGGPMPPTPAGEHQVCPTCSAWLTDHRDRMLPAAALAVIEAALTNTPGLHPTTERRLRLELVGMVRHLADALTAPGTLPEATHPRPDHRGELRGRPQPGDFAREVDE
ncbi:hypothetical protein [Micromonospora sp. C41]|uniref:hypothetical protein n=1 Tax=Micromonospora sp. C41 TaxID=2824878 RepID=UPI001B368E8F|nr:hypothetical protein [Micromonospora sp. C41]MBQ1060049.1 hypothetical protein [Micromonospora sp. C41]